MNQPTLRSSRTTPRAAGAFRTALTRAGAVVVLLGLLAGCGQKDAGEPQQQPSAATSQSRTVAGSEQLTACPSTPSKPPVPGALPDVSLPCLGNGPDTRLADLRGPMLVNIWAQWCTPCREEAPLLAQLHRKAGTKVKLVGIDYADPKPELAVRFAVDAQWDYPHLVDPDKVLQKELRIGGPPLTAFVDADGKVVYVHRKPFADQQELDRLVKDKLGVSW